MSFKPLGSDISMKTFILQNKEASRPLESHSGHESVPAHFSLRSMQVNTHMCSHIQEHPPSPSVPSHLLSRSPFFVLQVTAAVVKEDVAVLCQGSLHHSDAAVQEALKVRRVQYLLPLLLRELPQHGERTLTHERLCR